jgi:hypothetical protein
MAEGMPGKSISAVRSEENSSAVHFETGLALNPWPRKSGAMIRYFSP